MPPRLDLRIRTNSPRACRRFIPLLLTIAAFGLATESARCDEPLVRIKFTDSMDTKREVDGKVVVTAEDGGILLLGRDGRLWNITPARMENREKLDGTFTPFTADEVANELLKDIGNDGNFRFIKTKHYVIAANLDGGYAEWCGSVFEALLKSFYEYWESPELKLHEPEFPLVAIVLPNRARFAEFATKHIGDTARTSHGYYHVPTNRIVLCDLTADLPETKGRQPNNVREALQASAYNVATVVHEATHQIAFNSGMHTRLADNPIWLTEGMAMFCETPDMKSRNGWKTIGVMNKKRLGDFQNFIKQRRKPDSLKTLISDSRRFAGDQQLTGETYSEAWALTYFLVKTRREKYTEYLERIAKKKPFVWETPEARLKEFEEAFGELDKLDREFLGYIRKLRAR